MKTIREIFREYIKSVQYLIFLFKENPDEEQLKLAFKKYIKNYKEILKTQDFSLEEIIYS